MKKIFTLALFLLCCTLSFSQISADGFEEDGSRVIISKRKLVAYSAFKYSIFARLINVISVNDGDTYFLQLTPPVGKRMKEYAKGRRLLVKMDDGTIVELVNQKTVGVDDYDGLVAEIRYSIKDSDIEKITSGKAVKLRIEDDFEFTDVNVKGNLFSKEVKILYDAIQKEKKIKKRPNSEGLYDGF